MVFGQKIVWKALERGQKQFGSLVDLCAQLVADVAADFIIKEGGWVSESMEVKANIYLIYKQPACKCPENST